MSVNWTKLFADRTRHMRRSAIRELLRCTRQPEMISFAGGLPAPEMFPLEEIRAAAKALTPSALQYGETEGVAELRDWIAQRFNRPRENVLIVSGAQQGLDLLG